MRGRGMFETLTYTAATAVPTPYTAATTELTVFWQFFLWWESWSLAGNALSHPVGKKIILYVQEVFLIHYKSKLSNKNGSSLLGQTVIISDTIYVSIVYQIEYL